MLKDNSNSILWQPFRGGIGFPFGLGSGKGAKNIHVGIYNSMLQAEMEIVRVHLLMMRFLPYDSSVCFPYPKEYFPPQIKLIFFHPK